MVDIDKEFPRKSPFGVVMTAQWFGCFVLLAILYCSPYYYGGTFFVFFCAWTIFLVGLHTWIAHLLGFQRQVFNIGKMSAFIPFALSLFVSSLLFFFFFCISALVCIISMFLSIRYAASLFFIYLFAALLCLFCAAMCGYLAVLLYRATPNGLILNLRTVIIEGDKTSTISTATTTSSPEVYPQGINPV